MVATFPGKRNHESAPIMRARRPSHPKNLIQPAFSDSRTAVALTHCAIPGQAPAFLTCSPQIGLDLQTLKVEQLEAACADLERSAAEMERFRRTLKAQVT